MSISWIRQTPEAGARLAVLLILAAVSAVGSAAPVAAASTPAPAAVASEAENEARIVSERRLGPRVLELTISTPAFPTPTHVHVDLPAGYEQDRGRRWPVTYYLAGTNGTYRSFNDRYEGVRLSADYPSLVVAPNGDSGYWSDWFNNGAGGPPRYESFVIDQLIPLIDERFRTAGTRASRAVMGESMGGYGVMMLAARHPDMFAAASSLSGTLDTNLPGNGAAVTASPALQGAAPDSIYGPRAAEEVRWRGHNPTDLAANLRPVLLQARSAAAVPDPALGEGPADVPTCAVEAGVDMSTTNFHQALQRLQIPHLYERYPTGCHSDPNFKRQITATFDVFARQFARPAPPPTTFTYRAIEPTFDVFGWDVNADPARALEFFELSTEKAGSFTLSGSGRTEVTTPADFRPGRRVEVTGATTNTAVADGTGRLRLVVDLGQPNATQQYTAGASTASTRRVVTFRPAVAEPRPGAVEPSSSPAARQPLDAAPEITVPAPDATTLPATGSSTTAAALASLLVLGGLLARRAHERDTSARPTTDVRHLCERQHP
jgi:S-formylglutathione hydrolase FrmB